MSIPILTMENLEFEHAHKSLHNFCEGNQRMTIPVQKDDDDMIISQTLETAEYQIKQLKLKIESLQNLVG